MFLCTTFLSNFADDSNLYTLGNYKEETKRVLVEDFKALRFYENYMILNTGKYHYMCMSKDVDENETTSQQKMINSKDVDILGIKIDRKLSFHQHIKSIFKKADQRLSALLRISPYLEDKKVNLFIIQ